MTINIDMDIFFPTYFVCLRYVEIIRFKPEIKEEFNKKLIEN